MPKNRNKPYWEMNLEELREATREFDRELIADTFGPMTPEARARWKRFKRRAGRPRVGKGSKAISVTMERGLLRDIDRMARKLKVSRSRLLAHGAWRLLKAG